MVQKTTTLLCILDGWGHSKEIKYNAIAQAKTPNWDYLTKNYPTSLLETSGEAVGLPKGQMGNSEVGHLTIGSGRIILQTLPKINRAIKAGEISEKEELIKFK